ncbi:MAG TPA: IS110 family transposase [Blastococcus sp.]
MQVETDEPEIIERVAALDVGKAKVVCCARVPGSNGQRMQEVRTVSTMTAALLALGDWLADLGVTRVVMEATSDYWRAPFYLLEDRFQTWLVNAKDVKHLPGRPKTDRLDAVWLCKVAERQMLRPSFVPPPQIRALRDLTRYRVDLLVARTAEKQRAEKLLEDALIKLSVVVSDPFGVSGRAIMAALVAGERDPAALAGLARGTLRSKTDRLVEALTGRFTDHHAFLLARMLQRIDGITADIAAVQARIEGQLGELAPAVARLDAIPGVGPVAAQMILAESGSPGALPHRGPLRTVRAPPRRTRLKQAARALRVEVPASCVGGRAARGGRRRGSSGFGSHPSCPSRRGGRGVRRRSPCVPRPATSVPSPRGTGVGRG